MNDFDDSYRAIPLRFIIGSFALAMLLDFMPLPFDTFFWLLDFTALTLLYWTIHQPHRVGMGLAFVLGLVADVATATALGLHALSYTAMVFFILYFHRRIWFYGHLMQLAAVLGALLCNQAVLVVVRLFLNRQIITWQSFIAPFVGALLWPLLSQLMLFATRFHRSRS